MRDSPTVLVPRRLAPATLALAATVAIAACNDGGGGSTEQFCADLQEHAAEIVEPRLSTQADVEAYLDLHEQVGRRVPLAIEEDWDTYVGAVQAAAAVVAGNTESIEEARRRVFAAEEASIRFAEWVTANCGFDLAASGPVVQYDPPPTTETIPGATAPPEVPGTATDATAGSMATG